VRSGSYKGGLRKGHSGRALYEGEKKGRSDAKSPPKKSHPKPEDSRKKVLLLIAKKGNCRPHRSGERTSRLGRRGALHREVLDRIGQMKRKGVGRKEPLGQERSDDLT